MEIVKFDVDCELDNEIRKIANLYEIPMCIMIGILLSFGVIHHSHKEPSSPSILQK